LRSAGRESFAEIDAQDVSCDGVIDPPLFDQRHQQRAGFLGGAEAMGGGVGAVGVRLHGGGGGENENVGVWMPLLRGFDDRLDDAGYGDADGGLDLGHREGGGGIAGDDEVVGAMGLEE